MNPEYVKIDTPEINYGEKNLLQSQLGIINITKKFKEYERLRKEELLLKIHLKSKIEELKNSLSFFDRLIPKLPKEKEEIKEKANQETPAFPEQEKEQKEETRKRLLIDKELEEIKARLSRLQ